MQLFESTRNPPMAVVPGQHDTSSSSSSTSRHVQPERILYVVSLFPCWSETFIVREIHALLERGVDIRILSLKPATQPMVHPQAAALLDRVLHPATGFQAFWKPLATALRHPGLLLWFAATVATGLWRHPLAIGKSIVALWRALGRADEIRDFDPRTIHAPWATYPATVAWFLSKLFRRPFSFTSRAHDIFLEDHMMARKLQQAALAVTITEYNVRLMARWMPEPGAIPVRVIHSALNLPELPFVREGREPRKLLAVGRLDPIKGFDVLLAALALLRDRGVDFRCTVIGEGPLRKPLEKQRAALGLDGLVDFAGAMPHGDVKRHMGDATLMVMPCVVTPEGNSDGIPNVLMEAMASGLPVVSTRVSGIPELVEDGTSGRLVAPGDPAALAAAVASLLEDPAMRERYAAAGRRKVEQDFDVRIEAGRLLDHFGAMCHA